jgi:hypothetical protein
MRPDIVPGGVFPDYELPDHTSTPRKLSELQGDDPLILTLARGHYCPKEHQQHLEPAAFYPKIAVAYTQIATISTDIDIFGFQQLSILQSNCLPFLSCFRSFPLRISRTAAGSPETCHSSVSPIRVFSMLGLAIFSSFESFVME